MNKGINIKVDCVDPYGALIQDAFVSSFPTVVTPNSRQIVDNVANEILATGQVRFGPMPNIESQAAIRAVIRSSVERGEPISILCPWGSKKPVNGNSIDVAEMMGLKTLKCLHDRIAQYYPASIHVRIRLEDVGGYFLFRDEGEPARESSRRYVSDFENLVKIFGFDFIQTVKESELTGEEEYIQLSDSLTPLMLAYLRDTDLYGFENYQSLASWKALSAQGWQGEIPIEQRDFYRSRYAKIYGADLSLQTLKLAEYLAGSLARYKLKATGAKEEWGRNFIQLNFAPPAPGAPQGIVERRIHYRTIPMKYTRDHLPAWRAKGYYRIKNDNTVTPALASWFDQGREFNPSKISLSRAGMVVDVTTNYVLI